MRAIRKSALVQAGALAAAAAVGFGLLSASGDEQARAASPHSYSVKGLDTSHHNHGDKLQYPIHWPKVVSAGYRFAFHKATQGTTYRDPSFAKDFPAAAKAGLMNAPYHFYSKGSGAAQAQHFISTVRAAGYNARTPGQLPAVLDLEKRDGRCPAGVTSAQISAFLAKTREAFGVTPIIYTSKDFTDTCLGGNTTVLKNSPLWIPRYESGSAEPKPVGGRSWSFWQHSQTGSVPGVRGNTDVNVYRSSLGNLRKLARLTPGSTPAPPSHGSKPPVTSPSPSPTESWPLLKSGTRGVNVTTAQQLLTAAGHSTTPDAVFGPDTARATRAFQRSHGLAADGIIGPDTWHKLTPTVRTGSRGDAVKAAQSQLAAHGHRLAVDGVFGPDTERATRAFQRSNNLSADGIIGPRTWHKLITAGKTAKQPTAPTTPQHNKPRTPADNSKITNQQALPQLKAAGITHTSTGNCTERREHCTSFDGLRARTLQGIIALRKASTCPITVTAGTEPGHAAGRQSHSAGYKLDVRSSGSGACITRYIQSHNTFDHVRSDRAKVYKGKLPGGITAQYALESDHWDITFI